MEGIVEMEGIYNDSVVTTAVHELIINGSSPGENYHHHHAIKSPLLRILYSYDAVNKAIIPILFLVGAIGNGLSVTVFCMAPSHRHLSSSYYLSALAISDTGFLINLLAVWLEDMGYRVITSGLMCPLVMYLGQVTCFLSVWLTVSFTVERFFAVCYPLTRPTVCTVARAKKVIGTLTVLALVAFSYVWLIARVLDYPLPPASGPMEDPGGGGVTQEDVYFNDGGGGAGVLSQENFVEDNGNFTVNTGGGGAEGTACKEADESSNNNSREPSQAADFLSAYVTCGNGTIVSTRGSRLLNESGGVEVLDILTLCSVRPEHIYISSIASHIDSLLTLILPFFIITYLNVRIAICVWKLKDQRQNIVASAKISTTQHHRCSATGLQMHQQHLQQNLMGKGDHPSSSGCRIPNSKSSPLLNGGNGGGGTGTSLQNCKSYRINIGNSTTSLNSTGATLTGAGGTGGVLGGRNTGHKGQSSSTSASEARVTKTLLLVSTSFLVLNLPAHAIRAVAYIQSLWGQEMVEELQAAQQWANILFNMNFSVNFLLYCVSGRNFRKSLWSIFFSGAAGGGRSGKNNNGKFIRDGRLSKRNTSKMQTTNNSSSAAHGTNGNRFLPQQHSTPAARYAVQQAHQQQQQQNPPMKQTNIVVTDD